jgi:hypothetical protein
MYPQNMDLKFTHWYHIAYKLPGYVWSEATFITNITSVDAVFFFYDCLSTAN